ncbi:mechanosensitive ion channel family protein [Salinimonas marina]|uniref:Small-conductance mechanosensitive channel n=1 Tax=Salinimonas marina TaxID=2785918 RepID=A0A7S9HD67_9ALTE|nr:mechanosensitive ion channel family protein [Salinimonas marina]QPG05236.1 mechanosensitive ion channel family protein [Salinimonas marina]
MFEKIQSSFATLLGAFGTNSLIQASVAILLSFLAATLFKKVIIVSLKKLIQRSDINLGSEILDLLRAPIYYSVLMIGLWIALTTLKPTAEILYIESAVLKSIGVIIWTVFLLKASGVLLKRLAQYPEHFKAINSKTLPLFLNMLSIIIIVVSVYVVFSQWDIDMTAWLASAGIVGIAVGFAAKDTLANLFSGVFIMADAPYKVGDYVILDSTDRGEITHIGIRSTRMLTRDDVEITIPNSVMGNSKIINESGGVHEKSRCRIPIGVAYHADIDLVRAVLMTVAQQEELVCKDPEPRVRFRRFGGSALDFELLVWVDKPALKGRLIDILNSQIVHQFKAHKIEIPYAKHDLFIKEFPFPEDDK